MKNPPKGYREGCNLTAEIVQRFKSSAPAFVFPHVALIASIADVGARLARNDAARWLVEALIVESKRRKLADVPTVLMLRAVLELEGIPFELVPLEALGLSADYKVIDNGKAN